MSKDVEAGVPVRDQARTRIPHWKLVFEQGVLTPEVVEWKYDGAGTEENPYRVVWIDNDPRNPQLWPTWQKWMYTMLFAWATLAVTFVSSAYTGGVAQIIEQFHVSDEVVILGVSLFVLGFAVGPLFWAPLSELYGRQTLFAVTYLAVTVLNAGAAGVQNIWSLIILRFLAGAFGSSPLTNAGGVIADMFSAEERGIAMGIFASAPFLGPALGPMIGGFVGETVGWRWVEGVMACFTGVLLIVVGVTVPETYAPVLLRRRAAALSRSTGKVYRTAVDIERGPTTLGNALNTALTRPWILLFREPIVFLLSIYMAIIYGTLYMLFAAYPIVYQEYRHWTEGVGGLAFMGVMIGMMIGVLYSIIDNGRYKKVSLAHKGFAPPEARLPPAEIGGLAIPVGMAWFAWTNYPSIHWMASIAAGVPFGFGTVLVFLSIMNYLIDAYTIFAASVLAANAVLRSLFGAAFPLFTTYMYNSLGIHWASMVPAFLALACVPFPFLFRRYGAAIRTRCKFAAEAATFMDMLRQRSTAAEDAEQEEEEEEEREQQQRRRDIEKEEEEGPDDSPRDAERGRFQSIKAKPSQQSVGYEGNPYDIDRVNTQSSFGHSRSNSLRNKKSWRSFRSRDDAGLRPKHSFRSFRSDRE